MKGKSKQYSLDLLMLNVNAKFAGDYDSFKGTPHVIPNYMEGSKVIGIIRACRDVSMPGCFKVSPYIYKWERQRCDLLKRYRFKHDVYTTKQLNDMTWSKFCDTQMRLGYSQYKPESYTVHLVLQKARALIREALGKYNIVDHMAYCRFGKKACVGTRANEAYIDRKLENLTGTRQHIRWFTKQYLTTDPLLMGIVSDIHLKSGKGYEVCDTLAYTQVPKSYKILRGIMPNTAIGSFYTYGLGKLLEKGLLKCGIDLSKQQERHKRWARKSSVTMRSFTMDLSSASDSFTSWLLNAVLPRDWFNAIKYGRAANLSYKGSIYKMQSFMGMGIGFTFPLQTLVYWALLQAIQSLLGIKPGLISVFGDDIIAPVKMYEATVYVLQRLGFVINMDKTFHDLPFRESCGGDYFKGVDVRPFSPEGEGRKVGAENYLAFLYKLINGFKQRWEVVEIPYTYGYLLAEITRVAGVVHQVPLHYPDYAGVQVTHRMSPGRVIKWSPVWLAKSTNPRKPHIQGWTFICLAHSTDNRLVERPVAYLWDKLRAAEQGSTDDTQVTSYLEENWSSAPIRVLGPSMFRWLGVIDEKTKRRKRRIVRGKSIVCKYAHVPIKGDSDLHVVFKASTESVWPGAVTAR